MMVSSPTFNGGKSSPERLGGYFLSAPTSPSRVSEFDRDFDHFSPPSCTSTIRKEEEGDDDNDDFAFFVSEESDALSASAEDLFDGGKIKPLKVDFMNTPLLPTMYQAKKVIVDALSSPEPKKKLQERESFGFERRGRERIPTVLSSSNSGRRATRSHSPNYRIYEQQHHQIQSNKEESSSSSSSNPTDSCSKSSRRWSFKDFLLFRSASEGRGSSKDPFRKYSVLYKKTEEIKNPNFRSSDSPRRKNTNFSAHEFHYAIKKAESQDLKKKTFLPYKQGILGRLAGLGSFTT